MRPLYIAGSAVITTAIHLGISFPLKTEWLKVYEKNTDKIIVVTYTDIIFSV